MGILSRLTRLCRSDLHGVMDQLEDNDLLLKQYLREMEESLKLKRARCAQMTQTGQDLERDLAGRRQTLAGLESDLNLAVRREKDDIARMLIRKRRTLEAGCIQLQQQLDRLQQDQTALTETLDQQSLQYEQLKTKAALFHQQSEQKRAQMPDIFDETPHPWATPSEEEIELELLQRKETVRAGGES